MALADSLAESRLDGEVAVVTGGASGIGEVVARALAAAGARVDVAKRHGRLDVLFNNAGIAIRQPTTELSLEDWSRLVRRIEQLTPMGRLAEPEELVGAVLFLASRASAMVTGHVLAIDGGFLAQ